MIVNNLKDILGGTRDVCGPGWNSRRVLVRSEGMGYSINDTIIAAGATMTLEYKKHLESCYCISGSGSITDLASGTVHRIESGTLYALNQHDKHTLTADDGQDMRLICVFNPPLQGDEVHGPDGSYG
ncbi:MAG: ectoine synthase [Pseudomonadales bacterium]